MEELVEDILSIDDIQAILEDGRELQHQDAEIIERYWDLYVNWSLGRNEQAKIKDFFLWYEERYL